MELAILTDLIGFGTSWPRGWQSTKLSPTHFLAIFVETLCSGMLKSGYLNRWIDVCSCFWMKQTNSGS